MTIEQVWPFDIDWSGSVSEILEWKTAVLSSPLGAEQRFSSRIGPRRQLDLPYVVTGQERSLFDLCVMARGGTTRWVVPLPHEIAHCGSVTAGQTVFTLDTTDREFFLGGHVILRDDSSHVEALGIAGVAPGSVTTTTPALLNYTAASSITPAVFGVLADAVTSSRETAQVQHGTVRFAVQEPNYWPPLTHTPGVLPTYDGGAGGFAYPVLLREPNAITALDFSYERRWTNLDNDTGIPQYVDTAQRGFASQKYSWFLEGAAEQTAFRDLLYRLAGMRSPMWVPTFNDDVAPGHGYISPQGLFGSSVIPGRDRVITFNRDGSYAISGSAAEVGDAGLPPWQFDFGTARRISFISLKRLATDSVEIVHHSDLKGVATVSLVLRDAPDLRVPG